jgi:3-methyladenine DNA glycosylase AlkD
MDIVRAAKEEIENLSKTPTNQEHIITADIRYVSGRLYGALEDRSIDKVLVMCELLLEEHSWPMSVIAFDWAYRKRKEYTRDTFTIFESWLIRYVRGWGDCDDFCTHAFGELIAQFPELMDKVRLWTSREEFWMRRAAAVILIPVIRHGDYKEFQPLDIADTLMNDEHYLVCKGYGWMLKVLSQKDQMLVYEYLWKYRDIMPRISYRYALEKMDHEKKDALMNK